MRLPGCAAIPAPYRERGQIAYETGLRAVEIVHEDLKPSDILTREAFENAIVANSAIGGSTNAPIHINAIARHVGVALTHRRTGRRYGYDVPLLVDMQPAGKYLGEDYLPRRRPAGRDARTARRQAHPRRRAAPSTARPLRENVKRAKAQDADVIRPYKKPLKTQAGFKVLHGQPVRLRHHEDERDLGGVPRALSVEPEGPERVRGPRRRVRRTGGLSPPHRRSRAQDRREHHAVHARRRADRLSGLGRGGEHAAAGGADQARHHVAAVHRRRPAVGHVGLALDPQRLAGGGGRRRPGAAQDRRPRAHRPQQGHRRYPDPEGRTRRRAAPRSRSAAASTIRRARRRGRKSSAAWSISSPTAWCSSPRSSTSASRSEVACRGTITDRNQLAFSDIVPDQAEEQRTWPDG